MDINYVYNTLENNPEMIGQREGSADFVTYEPDESEEGGVFVVNDMKGVGSG